jgi:hypothetical protein
VTGSLARAIRALVLFFALLTACGSAAPGPTTPSAQTTPVAPESGCADVVDAVVTKTGDGIFSVDATVMSSDTGWDKYADAWEVRLRSGEVIGTRVLTHPHETEQPFSRSLGAVGIPSSERSIIIAARDSRAGFCGRTFEARVPD